jgi:23S rRNA (guanosine2251-2'-O)-methyltransferase
MAKRKRFPGDSLRDRNRKAVGALAAESRTSVSGVERPKRRHSASGGAPDAIWLFGVHPVLEALATPRRSCRRLLVAHDLGRRLEERFAGIRKRRPMLPDAEPVSREELAVRLPAGAAHQGLALLAEPLAQPALEDLLRQPLAANAVVVVLDQVTDPHNLGAILRSAAAFGAAAVVSTRRHAPGETGTLAKAASGALEYVPYVRIVNLARGLDALKRSGFWCIGLAAEAERSLAGAKPDGRVVVVLGAEGGGLRRLTRERCDLLARLPTGGAIEALNVSNAAAIALYELLGRGDPGAGTRCSGGLA